MRNPNPGVESSHSVLQRPDRFAGAGRALARCALYLLAGVLLSAAVLANSGGGKSQYAPIMPRAINSVLIDIEPAGPRLVVVGERGHVLFSDDNGDSWQQGKMPFTRMLTGVSFVDDRRGWAVGHQNMIFHTNDGGETWQRQLDGFKFQAQFNADNLLSTRDAYEALATELKANPDESRAIELEDALFAYEDAEFYLDEPVVPTNLHDVWFLDENNGWAVGAFGRLLATRDGGNTWVDQSQLVITPDGFHLNSITGTEEGVIVIVGEGGVIFRSIDAGHEWEQVDAGHSGSLFGVVYDPVNNLLTTFGLGGALLQSDDLGQSWRALNSKITSPIAGGTVTGDGKTVLAGSGGVILVVDPTAGGSVTLHPQASRMNQSTLLAIGEGSFLAIGLGGVKPIQLN